jgi:hypothetical protein
MSTLNGCLGFKFLFLGMNLDSFKAKLNPCVGCCFGHYISGKTSICDLQFVTKK